VGSGKASSHSIISAHMQKSHGHARGGSVANNSGLSSGSGSDERAGGDRERERETRTTAGAAVRMDARRDVAASSAVNIPRSGRAAAGGGGAGGGLGNNAMDDDAEGDQANEIGSGSGSSTDFQSEDDDYAWIPWFCSLKGNEFFCEVDDTYVQDSFNLTGLQQMVPYFDQALDMILDIEPSEVLSDDQQEMIENDAENLFGLIHARYILTGKGLQAMYEKYRNAHFGQVRRNTCKARKRPPAQHAADAPFESRLFRFVFVCSSLLSLRLRWRRTVPARILQEPACAAVRLVRHSERRQREAVLSALRGRVLDSLVSS
jgi:hypothetical protein